MLAEGSKKQKWTLNPRGKLWTTDNNKLGQRLLEKMGWKSGCGLGANLQGPTEYVMVPVKNDFKGVGFKGRAEDVEHQASFDKLLEELNGGVKEEVKVISLEQQSLQSRSRLHYQKFTRGKDLSRCSDKDLKGILGMKGDQYSFDVQEKEQNCDVLTVHGGNCNEYFENKLGNKLGFGAKEESVPEDNIQCDKIHKSKKNKCKKMSNSSSVSKTDDSELIVDELIIEDKVSSTSTYDSNNKTKDRKKKLKNRVKEFVTQLKLECEEIEGVNENSEKSENHAVRSLEELSDCYVSQKKKNKLDRRKKRMQKVLEDEHIEPVLQSMKAKKKRKICASLEDNLLSVKKHKKRCVDEDSTTVSETCVAEDSTAVSETCVEDFIINVCVESSEQDTESVHKKRSKKKKRKTSEREIKEGKLQESVATGIIKGPAVSDFGFKGSNIMCIKGYGVT